MGKPIAATIRRQIITLREQGRTYKSIHEELGVSQRSAEQICLAYKKNGEDSMVLYKNCKGPTPTICDEVRQGAIDLKRAHPGWGAEVVRIELARKYRTEGKTMRLPASRTLNSIFIAAGVNTPRKRCELPKQKVKRGIAPHDVWAVDAKEGIVLSDQTYSCTLNITDEGTGAVLAFVHFPLRYWSEVEPGAVQATLNAAFARWGLPKAMRFDNGLPWASKTDIPSALSLYWRSLGIRIAYGRPRVSTDNACVERTNQLVEQWAEPGAHTQEHWQAALDWASTLQREEYPYTKDRASRSQAFGDALRHSGRDFSMTKPDMHIVYCFLQNVLVQRNVNAQGQITLLQNRYHVGKKYAGATVFVRFEHGYWCIFDKHNQEIRRHLSQEMKTEAILRGWYHPHRYYQNSNVVKEQGHLPYDG
jgi:transposase